MYRNSHTFAEMRMVQVISMACLSAEEYFWNGPKNQSSSKREIIFWLRLSEKTSKIEQNKIQCHRFLFSVAFVTSLLTCVLWSKQKRALFLFFISPILQCPLHYPYFRAISAVRRSFASITNISGFNCAVKRRWGKFTVRKFRNIMVEHRMSVRCGCIYVSTWKWYPRAEAV